MRNRKTENGYLLRLEKGEELVEALTSFCKEHKITAGFLYGLGGTTSATLGYYNLGSNEYKFTHLDDLVEIANLSGNVAVKEGEPFLHLHATVADSLLRTFSGHVKELKVGGTCEIHLTVFNEPLERRKDTYTGLDLLDI
ncbi:MAG: PPC domain-containing DNA-binding protein [Candidatus Saccharimonadales bacterium]